MTTENNKQIEPCPVNDDPILFSLLYDLDLLPEQVKEGTTDWVRMNVIIEHWNRRANQPKETPRDHPLQPVIDKTCEILIRELESQLEDYRKALEFLFKATAEPASFFGGDGNVRYQIGVYIGSDPLSVCLSAMAKENQNE